MFPSDAPSARAPAAAVTASASTGEAEGLAAAAAVEMTGKTVESAGVFGRAPVARGVVRDWVASAKVAG